MSGGVGMYMRKYASSAQKLQPHDDDDVNHDPNPPWGNPNRPRGAGQWEVLRKQARMLLMQSQSPEFIATYLGMPLSSVQNIKEELRLLKACSALTVTPIKKEPKVNYQHLLTLLQEGYTTCDVAFKPEMEDPLYRYKCPTSMGLKEGDVVVVPAKDKLAVAYVCEIHDEPEIDVTAPFDLKWVACKVDLTTYNDQKRREEEAIQMLKDGERREAKDKAMAALAEAIPNLGDLRKLLNGTE